ncbi:DUF4307 domain-containing protein [Corynebacterium timonense]|uniref:DUF4307 domain-containing protein n=1 Tax=Corynebacterium timonense TaxID=441500 RepID=A0A1H1QP67_9CORY|nr:DUF4307 domain-containing protein [Corynebacterium timonense]SDS25272.1 protein of unknown function [Corynebacterium timonense]
MPASPSPAESPSRPPRRPVTRYGITDKAARPGGMGGKVLVAALVIVVVLIAVAFARTLVERAAVPVTAEFITQEAVDDSTTRLWIDVTRRNTDVPSYCIITAVDYSFAEVGRREVALPPGGETLTRIGVDLPVRAPGVSGRIYGCSEDIPFYLDTSQTHTEAR